MLLTGWKQQKLCLGYLPLFSTDAPRRMLVQGIKTPAEVLRPQLKRGLQFTFSATLTTWKYLNYKILITAIRILTVVHKYVSSRPRELICKQNDKINSFLVPRNFANIFEANIYTCDFTSWHPLILFVTEAWAVGTISGKSFWLSLADELSLEKVFSFLVHSC